MAVQAVEEAIAIEIAESTPEREPKLGRPATIDDLHKMPDDGRRYELIGGVIYVSPSPLVKHQYVSSRLHRVLSDYLADESRGALLYAPLDVELGPHDIVQPDLVFVRAEHRKRITTRRIVGPPDLVIEILSPSNPGHDLVRKAALYASAGVPEYWIVDPRTDTVRVLTLGDQTYVEAHDSTETVRSRVLDGLEIPVSELFAVPDWMETDDAEV